MSRRKITFRKIGAATLFLPADLEAFALDLPAGELDVKPTGPLLPVDEQKIALERARDAGTPVPPPNSRTASTARARG